MISGCMGKQEDSSRRGLGGFAEGPRGRGRSQNIKCSERGAVTDILQSRRKKGVGDTGKNGGGPKTV